MYQTLSHKHIITRKSLFFADPIEKKNSRLVIFQACEAKKPENIERWYFTHAMFLPILSNGANLMRLFWFMTRFRILCISHRPII